MKKWSIFLAVLPMMILSILFNAWCLQCVYTLSVIPILVTFDVIAPAIPFSIFIMVTAATSVLHTPQNSKTYDNAYKAFGVWLGINLAKLLSVGILYIVNLIIF